MQHEPLLLLLLGFREFFCPVRQGGQDLLQCAQADTYSIADMAVHQVSWSQRLCPVPGMVVWLQTYHASSWQALEHQEDDTVALSDAEKQQGRLGQAGLAVLQQTARALHWTSASWLS